MGLQSTSLDVASKGKLTQDWREKWFEWWRKSQENFKTRHRKTPLQRGKHKKAHQTFAKRHFDKL